MKQFVLLFSISTILFISCTKQDEQPNLQDPDYIVFGHFYGFCMGEECIEIFKLTGNELYEDTSDTYPRWDRYYEGQFVKLNQSKFELAKSLREDIPLQLLAEQDTVFGSPDAADGGGIYFAIVNEEQRRFWVIDQVDHNLPEYLKTFKASINESISLIND